ncbi:MAG TPA: regulatory protein RecX [Cellvibrio sp.]|nr:regulatory protein RecX [Cellvibrio sp.]
MSQELPSLSDVRFSAMRFLALREHSAKELKSKLEQKFASPDLIEAAITGLIELHLQSDERFAQAFVSMRQRQGKGPLLIKLELREKGISPELIARFVDDSDALWLVLAREAKRKKFHGVAPIDQRGRAKQIRFLQSRGFSSRHIKAAFDSVVVEDL